MKLAVVFIVQSRTLTTEMEETGFFLVSLGNVKEEGEKPSFGAHREQPKSATDDFLCLWPDIIQNPFPGEL